MVESPTVKGSIDRQTLASAEYAVVSLDIAFEPSEMFRPETAEDLEGKLIAKYEECRAAASKAVDCFAYIRSDAAGSPLVKALFDLWEHVTSHGGQLICCNYPTDYIPSLMSLGLPSLPGFTLARSRAEAFKRLDTLKKQRK